MSSLQASDELLSSLASYLSNFQNDLSAVSGHVADLQQKSDVIEAQLRGRKVGPCLTRLIRPSSLQWMHYSTTLRSLQLWY
jgi:hypothetical protein